jgi:hypothetical protein
MPELGPGTKRQQIDRGDDDQEEHSDADDDRWPDRSQTRDRDVDDDQQSDPRDQRTMPRMKTL